MIRTSAITDVSSRIKLVEMDVTSSESISNAQTVIAEDLGSSRLFGIVNNAGIGFGNTHEETCNTNFWGPVNVINAFQGLLSDGKDGREQGRIVNVASASGGNYVSSLPVSIRKWFLGIPQDHLNVLSMTSLFDRVKKQMKMEKKKLIMRLEKKVFYFLNTDFQLKLSGNMLL